MPGLTLATGGTYGGTSDPWAAFSADRRVLYVASLPFNNTNPDGTGGGEHRGGLAFAFDGGRRWDRPVLLRPADQPVEPDQQGFHCHRPGQTHRLSAWERLQIPPTLFPFRGPAMFSRTTDAGRTWKPARVLYDPGDNALTINHQLFPQANGTLYDVFTTFRVTALPPNPPAFQNHLTVLVSPTRAQPGATRSSGRNCSARRSSLRIRRRRSARPARPRVSPLSSPRWRWTRTPARSMPSGRMPASVQTCPLPLTGSSSPGPPTAARPGQIRPDQRDADRDSPTRPAGILPAIQVAGDGTIGVSYYDFRNNRPSATGGLADAWMVFCPPGADPTLAASWGGEVRLTNHSFEIAQAPLTTGGVTGGGYFLGDYVGLGATGHAFQAFFSVTTGQTATVVSRLVVPSWQRFH